MIEPTQVEVKSLSLYFNTVDPPNTAAVGTGEKMAEMENGGKGSHI